MNCRLKEMKFDNKTSKIIRSIIGSFTHHENERIKFFKIGF